MEDKNNTDQQTPASGVQIQKKWIIIGGVIVAVLVVAQYLFSPENVTERLLEQASNGEYDVSIDNDGTYSITSDEGESVSVTSGDATKIPDNWPSSVPIPSGANVEYAAVINGQANEAVSTVTYTTQESMQTIADLYKNELADNGWTIEAQVSTGDGFVVTATRGEDATSVYIANSDGQTSVTISVQTFQ